MCTSSAGPALDSPDMLLCSMIAQYLNRCTVKLLFGNTSLPFLMFCIDNVDNMKRPVICTMCTEAGLISDLL